MDRQDSWKQKYADAMLELDRTVLQGKIDAAQLAIQQEMKTQIALNEPRRSAELQALSDAMHNLRTLHRVEFSRGTSEPGGMSLQASEAMS